MRAWGELGGEAEGVHGDGVRQVVVQVLHGALRQSLGLRGLRSGL